jgi:putative nucleotidyltransferase with HDIG domain
MGFLGELLTKRGGSVEKLPATTPDVVERLRSALNIRQLESMPSQAARAFRLASDPKAQLGDFIDVVESDVGLSARVIRIANSVYFFRGTPATDIEKAISNIGLDELRCLLSATMLKSVLGAKHPAREQLWANSVATGIGARSLARLTRVSPGEAFLCGLLHDIGKLMMIAKTGALYDQVLRLVSNGELDFVAAENEILALNHVEVGKWLAEEWNFPQIAVQAIAYHHQPWPKESTLALNAPLIVKTADLMAHACGIGHPPTFRALQLRAKEELPRALTLFGLQGDEITVFLSHFETQFEREYGLYQTEAR